nr:unnamed protein product [Spirometra erinaceieuropaei]
MISKVHGKRFVYKFICDLKTLLGFSAGELYSLVKQCAEKHFANAPAASSRKRRLSRSLENDSPLDSSGGSAFLSASSPPSDIFLSASSSPVRQQATVPWILTLLSRPPPLLPLRSRNTYKCPASLDDFSANILNRDRDDGDEDYEDDNEDGGTSLTSPVFAGFPNNCSNAAAAAAAAAAGQIQHSQFLLELPTGWRHRDAIHWVNEDSEYKLSNPERVASMWGQRKNKLAKNKNTLPPALRYYYDCDMISKVQGKRFVYKFICDLKTLLGFSAGELYSLVKRCAEKHFANAPAASSRKRRLSRSLENDSPLDSSGGSAFLSASSPPPLRLRTFSSAHPPHPFASRLQFHGF